MVELLLAATGGSLSGAVVGAAGTIVTAIVLAALRWGVVAMQRTLNDGRIETTATLSKILTQTTATNGRVLHLEHDVAMLQGTVYGADAMKKQGGNP